MVSSLIIGLILFLVLSVFFKRYITPLFFDYVIDFGLSSLDNLIGGFGGFDVGDWLAAFIIFNHERKITNSGIALLVAWEAAGFIPLSFIPVFGEGLEIVTNLIPSTFIATLLFNKYKKANAIHQMLEDNIDLAKKIGVKISKEVKKHAKESGQMIKHDDPVDALKLDIKANAKIAKKVRGWVENLISQTQKIIIETAKMKTDAPEQLVASLRQGLGQASSTLTAAIRAEKSGDFKTAASMTLEARQIIENSLINFQTQYKNYIQETDVIDQRNS